MLIFQSALCLLSVGIAVVNVLLVLPSFSSRPAVGRLRAEGATEPDKQPVRSVQWAYGKFVFSSPEGAPITVEGLAPAVKSAYIPDSGGQDVVQAKKLVIQHAAPKVFLIARSMPSARLLKALGETCEDLEVVCVVLLREGDAEATESKVENYPGFVPTMVVREEDISSFISSLGDTTLRPDAPALTFLFDTAANLIWYSDVEETEDSHYDLNLVLRTIVALHRQSPTRQGSDLEAAANNNSREAEDGQLPLDLDSTEVIEEPRSIHLSKIPGKIYNLEGAETNFGTSWVATRRKPVLLIFWTTWCQPCVNELPDLQRLWKSYGEKALFVGVAEEPKGKLETIKKLLNKNGVTYPQYRVAEPVILQTILGRSDYPPYPVFALFDSNGGLIISFIGALHDEANRAKLEKALTEL